MVASYGQVKKMATTNYTTTMMMAPSATKSQKEIMMYQAFMVSTRITGYTTNLQRPRIYKNRCIKSVSMDKTKPI